MLHFISVSRLTLPDSEHPITSLQPPQPDTSRCLYIRASASCSRCFRPHRPGLCPDVIDLILTLKCSCYVFFFCKRSCWVIAGAQTIWEPLFQKLLHPRLCVSKDPFCTECWRWQCRAVIKAVCEEMPGAVAERKMFLNVKQSENAGAMDWLSVVLLFFCFFHTRKGSACGLYWFFCYTV